ncbi:hypothetical protein [Pedobacter sp.]|uniref:hypothetical protein n=1 Tax=Pedobacter sp. TaxID=1411316 RepID=UPI003C4A1D28
MSNPLEPGEVRRTMEAVKRIHAKSKQMCSTQDGRMEILYEMLADGDITMDQFNLFSSLENKKWNK